jgi:hypothetical protein
MPARIVHYAHRPKRPPRKRKSALAVPAIVTRATRRNPADAPPASDMPEPTPPPANDDAPATPAPPAARSAIVSATSRKRAKLLRADEPEADARVRAFVARMTRPPAGRTEKKAPPTGVSGAK